MASFTTPSPSPLTVPTVCPGHSRPVVGLHYVHADNQTFLISASLDRAPMLRSGTTGDWIGTFAGHKGAVWSAKLNATATKAATGSGDFTAKIWDAVDGTELQSFKHKHIVKCVEFAKNGSKLLTGARDKQLRVFDLEAAAGEAASAPTCCMTHPDSVTRGIWTSDEHLVVSGGEDGVLRTWDLRSSSVVQEHTFGPGSPVTDMEMTSDGEMLAVAAGKNVIFFNVTNPKNVEIIKKHVCKLAVESVSIHPDKKTFLTAGTDLWVYEHDFATLAEVDCKKGHHGPVHVVKYATDGKSYASGADDATLRLWTKKEEDESGGSGSGSGGSGNVKKTSS